MKVLITGQYLYYRSFSPFTSGKLLGASGILGNAIFKAFREIGSDFQVTGLSYTNSSPLYRSLDLQDSRAVEELFAVEWNGGPHDVVIHCAAERRPDVAEKVSNLLFHLC
jgi:S-adenosylmethionine synthetase